MTASLTENLPPQLILNQTNTTQVIAGGQAYISTNWNETSLGEGNMTCALYSSGALNQTISVNTSWCNFTITAQNSDYPYLNLTVNATDTYSNSAMSGAMIVLVNETENPSIALNQTNAPINAGETLEVYTQWNDLTLGQYNLTCHLFIDGTLNQSKESNGIWCNFTYETALSDYPSISVKVNATDYFGNTGESDVMSAGVIDTVAPQIPSGGLLIYETGSSEIYSISESPTITTSGNITISWTIVEENLNQTRLYIDGILAHTSTGNEPSYSANLSAGTRTLKFEAEDLSGNENLTANYTVRLNSQEDVDALMLQIEADSNIESATLKNEGGDKSGTGWLNETLTLELLLNVSGVQAIVEIIEFNGLNANWNRTNFTSVVAADSSQANRARISAGTNVTLIMLLNSFSDFLASGSFGYGAKIFFNQSAEGLDVLYIADDVGNEVYVLETCEGGTPPTGAITIENMCYINGTENVTLYVPHLSGGALANDTIAPIISLTSPANSSEINNSYFTFSFSVNETNPEADFCWYNLTNGTDSVQETILASEIDWVGTRGSYALKVFALSQGDHNLTLNCSDQNSQSSQERVQFSVADTTPPQIESISASSSGATTITVTLTATTDEPAICKYSLQDITNFSQMSLFSTTGGRTHTKQFTYTSNSSGYYYLLCEDEEGNTMPENNRTAYNAQIVSGDTPPADPVYTGGSGSSGSFWVMVYGATEDELKEGYSKSLSKGHRIRFNFEGEVHHVGLVDILGGKAIINVSSAPQQASILEGEGRMFNLNGDGYYDILVKILSLAENSAIVWVGEIHSKIESPPTQKPTIKEEIISPPVAEPKDSVCVENSRKCVASEVHECRNGQWVVVELCSWGCDSQKSACLPPPQDEPKGRPAGSFELAILLVLVMVLLIVGYTKRKKVYW